jgi:hypothetical protein
MKGYFEKLSAERSSVLEILNTYNAANILGSIGGDFLDAKHLFFAHFGRIPNCIFLDDDIDVKKANEWFAKNYRDAITDCCYGKRFEKRTGMYLSNVYYFLYDDLLVHLNRGDSEATFLYQKTDSAQVDMIANEINRFKTKKSRRKPQIELISQGKSGLCTKSMKITPPKFSIEDNYNEDFRQVHQTILNRLRRKNDKGLVLLHGKPGTGKTSYIRYLITKTNKNIIFLPPGMAACITDPGLMNVLIDNPNSVFVIEDAENIVIDRNRSGSSPVSALLNLADGLLSDCLNIQIVCSFNTDLSRVDNALTRKGRLIAKYEFLELDVHKAQALSDRLGFSSVIASPMTLAAIYNQHETDFEITAKRKNLGFCMAS